MTTDRCIHRIAHNTARCQRVFSLAYVFVPSPPLLPSPPLRFFSFFLFPLRRSVWIAFWREFPLSFLQELVQHSPRICARARFASFERLSRLGEKEKDGAITLFRCYLKSLIMHGNWRCMAWPILVYSRSETRVTARRKWCLCVAGLCAGLKRRVRKQ